MINGQVKCGIYNKFPGHGVDYISKTDGMLYEPTEEHAWTSM